MLGAHLGSWEIGGTVAQSVRQTGEHGRAGKGRGAPAAVLDCVLSARSFKLIATDGHPLRSIPIAAALRRGEIVALLGDRTFGGADVLRAVSRRSRAVSRRPVSAGGGELARRFFKPSSSANAWATIVFSRSREIHPPGRGTRRDRSPCTARRRIRSAPGRSGPTLSFPVVQYFSLLGLAACRSAPGEGTGPTNSTIFTEIL